MRNLALATLALVTVLASPAAGQSQGDYDKAARQADNAVRAYKDLQYTRNKDILDASMAMALVDLHICKPMFEQSALSRRQYIVSKVKGRGKQRAVSEECAEREMWMAKICEPRTAHDENWNVVKSYEPSCPSNWKDWPPPPMYGSLAYDQRLEEIRQQYK